MILTSVDDASISRVLDILTILYLQTGYEEYLSIDFIENLLGYEDGDVLVFLTDLHALVHVPSSEDGNRLRLHHASLRDFLMDKTRSTVFFIDEPARHSDLALRLLRYILSAPPSTCDADERRLLAIVNGFIIHCTKASSVKDIASALHLVSMNSILSKLSDPFTLSHGTVGNDIDWLLYPIV